MATRPDFLPNTEKSQKLRKLIREHVDMGYRTVSQSFSSWDNLEQNYIAYRQADDADKESLEKFGVKKIIVPIQFATVQIFLTFMMEIFTAMKPVLRVRGSDPSTKKRSRVMEVTLDYDYRGNKGYLKLHQWFFNAFRYGYGIMNNTWGEKTITKKIWSPSEPDSYVLDGQTFNVPGTPQYKNSPVTTFEGNMWRVVDNRSFVWDTRYPLTRFQDGVFVAERDVIHDHELYIGEEDGLYFNTKEIKAPGMYSGPREAELGSTSHNRDMYGGSIQWSINEAISDAKKNKMHVIEHIVIRVIPRDYNLSQEARPQDWVFAMIDNNYIIRAEPSPFCPRFPYSIIESYPDILATMSQGVMQLTDPLASHLNFLFNSHMANVRRAVNDRFVIDPSRISLDDLLDPENPVIRLNMSAYGSNPAEAVQQLSVVDITQNHVRDSEAIMSLWERILGTSSAMFGQIEPGRRSALELGGVFRQSGSRMKMMADMFSCEGVAPLTEQMAILRQENMSEAQFMELAGQTAADLGVHPDEIIDGYLKVRKSYLTGVFEYPAEEGVLPQDRQAAAQILQDTFNTVAQQPFLMQAFNPVSIFREMVRQKGIYHIDDFLNNGVRADVEIMSPDQLGELYASGQAKPVGRPDEGVREGRQGLTLNGAMNGAGRPQSPQ